MKSKTPGLRAEAREPPVCRHVVSRPCQDRLNCHPPAPIEKRSSQRLAADLDLLYVAPPGEPPRGEQRERVEALRRLASILGAPLLIEEGDDLAETAARIATERGTTYVFMARPRPRGAVDRLRESTADRLRRKLPGVDIRIVSDPR